MRLPDSAFVDDEDPPSGSVLVLSSDGDILGQVADLHPAATNVVPHDGQWLMGSLVSQPVRTMPNPL